MYFESSKTFTPIFNFGSVAPCLISAAKFPVTEAPLSRVPLSKRFSTASGEASKSVLLPLTFNLKS